jgi:hypothetical protein
MPLFKKRDSADVIDLTDLERKGIIEKANKIAQSKNPDGYTDLTQSESFNSNSDINQPTGSISLPDASNPLAGFFSGGSPVPSTSTNDRTSEDTQIKHLHTKIEDLEYKLERFLERLELIEDKYKQD